MSLFTNIFRRRRSRQSMPLQDAPRFRVLEKKIGYTFHDQALLARALVHRSCAGTPGRTRLPSNERLEFLGDAVLNLLVSEHLYRAFPDKQEGDLTRIRSLLVSRTILAQKAGQLDLGRYMLLGQGEEQSGGRWRPSILADGFEALLGALFLDGGKDRAMQFLRGHLLGSLDDISSSEENLNYKSLLQEHCQAAKRGSPVYTVCRETGPDHEKEFMVRVKIDGEPAGSGIGHSKREAEQKAAREALERMGAVNGP